MVWRELQDHWEVVYGAAVALVIVVLLTPAVAGMARRLGAVDLPDERRVHRIPIPRLGGLAMFFGVIVPALAFLDLSRSVRGLLVGAAVATAVGAVDDLPVWAGGPLTVLWIVAVMNMVNFLDGLDGLAAGVCAIAGATFAVISLSLARPNSAAFAAIVFGAALGFLRHNFFPARVFMGDSGALLLGFSLAAVSVDGL